MSLGVVVALDEDKRRRAAGIAPLVALVAGDMEKVNRLILSRTGSEVALIPEVANHLISSGGKRLRPMLTLAAARMCGYPGEGHVALAAGVEFMHTATLLHDDVVDDSSMQHGKLAARMLWGNSASVLVSDFLLGQAFKIMVDVGSLDALAVLSDAAAVIAEGEVRQLAAANDMATTEDEYLYVVHAKTASLFAAASEVGPILRRPRPGRAGRFPLLRLQSRPRVPADRRRPRLCRQFVRPRQTGGRRFPRGEDHAAARSRLSPRFRWRTRAFWQRAIETRDIRDGDLEQAVALMKHHNALDDTVRRTHHFGEVARDALAPFPDSPAQGGAARGGGFLHRAGLLTNEPPETLRRGVMRLRLKAAAALLAAAGAVTLAPSASAQTQFTSSPTGAFLAGQAAASASISMRRPRSTASS